MENSAIADYFSLLAKLSDIHGENSFKAKSYATAAFTIDKLAYPLQELPEEKIATIQGIGISTAKKITELLQYGRLQQLDALIQKTPEGILEMMKIKGIGPKKIATIWKEMGIETVGELRYACAENRLRNYKGFGEKTQSTILENVNYYLQHLGHFLYAQLEPFALELDKKIKSLLTPSRVQICGAFARQLETLEELEWVTDSPAEAVRKALTEAEGFIEQDVEVKEYLLFRHEPGIKIHINITESSNYAELCFKKTSSKEFISALESRFGKDYPVLEEDGSDFFKTHGLPFLPPYARELTVLNDPGEGTPASGVLTPDAIRGIIHCHSNWSDGSDGLDKMAEAAKQQGYAYLVISDHSKSAFYASGLQEDRIRAQHRQIDELNAQLAPFRIFKGIECDILNEGQLDYEPEVLRTFEVVIASIHSNLNMSADKAMMRLMGAIENPYTTILGHMTGRLLLSRKGYPVDHERIIDACAANGVAIELNANPSRLDIDWRHIRRAIRKGVLLSINPDAHHIAGFSDTRYGVLVAQKALLQESQNLSSFPLEAFETFLKQSHLRRG